MTDLGSLKSVFRGEIQTDGAVLDKYSTDTSIFKVVPQVVVYPRDSADVMDLVSWISAHKKANPDLSVTPRAAGTDMTGGPLSDSVVLDCRTHLNKILEIDDTYCVVQPGVYFRDLEAELAKRGLLFPPFPASKEICALGGMLANNAGGEKTLQYGKVDRYVESLRVVLADGKEHLVEPLDQAKFKSMMAQKSPAAEVYKKVYRVLTNDYGLIRATRPQVSKNSSGYNIWDVIKGNGFDLTKLFVGSQGTLGIITEAKLRLLPREKKEKLYVVFLNDLARLPDFVREVLALGPTSLEITDDHTLKIYLRFFREMADLLGVSGIMSQLRLFLPEMLMALRGGLPKLIVLVEFEGDDDQKLAEKVSFLAALVSRLDLRGHFCETDLEAAKYWRLRRDTFRLLRERVKTGYAAPFVDDVIVKPEVLPEFLPELTKIMDEQKIIYTISGHLGDGNLHILPIVDLRNEAGRKNIEQATVKVYDLVLKYKGSLSAEHGDGLIRSPYLEKQFGPDVYKVFKEIKQIFDPQNIFNPHKKTDGSWEWSRGHVRTQ